MIKKMAIGLLASSGLTSAVIAQDGVAPTSPATAVAPDISQMTVQQAFDAGGAAISEKDWAKAFAIYSSLEARMTKTTKSARSLAIVRLRKGHALFGLRRVAESEEILLAALTALPAADESLRTDRAFALATLADIAERRFEYPQAERYYRESISIEPAGIDKLRTYVRLLNVAPFVDREKALKAADEALALAASVAANDSKTIPYLHSLRGRALLNLGRMEDAKSAYDEAIRRLGGLSYKNVDIFDSTARSDAAITALLMGREERARELLHATGAAMQADQGFSLGQDMVSPECGGQNGPKPEDVAVVELQIAADGRVAYARPIYFSGTPAAAVEFAKSVSGWSWNPEELKKVSPFFRAQTRLEMRCTQSFPRPDAAQLIAPAFNQWMTAQGAKPLERTGSDAVLLPVHRTALAEAEKEFGPNSPRLIPALINLAGSSIVDRKEAVQLAERALSIALLHSADPAVEAFLLQFAARLSASLHKYYVDDEGGSYQKRLAAALQKPSIANDRMARGYLSLELFDSLKLGARRRFGNGVLKSIVEDPSLPSNSPLKVGALVRQANLEARNGKADVARELFGRTGLSERQCALLDARPQRKSANVQFPMEAMRWGFSGWTVMEFDILADGRTQNQRPTISFPPFVFSKPTTEQFRSVRYEMTYRPEGGLGCGAQSERVSYKMFR